MTTARVKDPLLLAILLAGAALRLIRLGAGSLWYDETVSAFLAGSPVPELLRHTAGDIHPPGYYLLLRGWLVLSGYPTGHADAHGQGLEFASALFSFGFGVLLIALIYALARRLSGRRGPALVAAVLAAISPYNIRYSQEVRMYTLAAALGAVVLYALWRATETPADVERTAAPARPRALSRDPRFWWAVYALAAAAGLYTLYYFVFLLVPVNVWAAGRAWRVDRDGASRLDHEGAKETKDAKHEGREAPGLLRVLRASRLRDVFVSSWSKRSWSRWLASNLAVLLLYAPWLPVAWRQATQPPVPPWRTAAAVGGALRESWTALAAGQAAPGWLWPWVLALAPIYLLGVWGIGDRRLGIGNWDNLQFPIPNPQSPISRLWPGMLLLLASAGSLALILLVSAVTPLYHVRYVFTYSPAFYVVLAAGLAWLWDRRKAVAMAAGAACIAGAAAGAYDFWQSPANVADDHRAAVAFLQERWRPGDVLVANAGYAYTAILTYWQGPVDAVGRLTGDLPEPRSDSRLVMLTTGHVDGGPGLGWGDPASDFYAMPSTAAEESMRQLFARFNRVWQYRIYDTVNDPAGTLRAQFEQDGQLCEDRVYPGEAYLRVQTYAPKAGVSPDESFIPASAGGLAARLEMRGAVQAAAGQTLYRAVDWQQPGQLAEGFATSVRLVDAQGRAWAQPPDEKPLGPLCPAGRWAPGAWQRQVLALPIPEGTPPGAYGLQLIAYNPATGAPFGPWTSSPGGATLASANAAGLGVVEVARPDPSPALRPALATFGPLALVRADTPATTLSPGDVVPVDLLWQAAAAPGEDFVVVLQLLDTQGRVAAGIEEQPLGKQNPYPTKAWSSHELVRDRHSLGLPKDLAPGEYRLIVGVYRAEDRARLKTRTGVFGQSDYVEIKRVTLKK